jgi:acyl-CoA reductase-like NAD-dependent aldehyde dehydrogenase
MQHTDVIKRLRSHFRSGQTRPSEFRLAKLKKLSAALETHEQAILAAVFADLRKSPDQAYASEIGLVQAEIRCAVRNLERWSSPKRGSTPLLIAPACGWVQPEPFGVCLIFSAWNYPVQLLLAPLVSAIAAGNCCVLKPSELAPKTAVVMTTLIKETFAEDFVCVVNGGVETAESLLRERFDKIFFTGSTNAGRAVMTAAAKHLTPVTLELGGKCPAIVCADADVELAAKRIAWGKFLNAGQTCVAPDFVLVQRESRAAFISALIKYIRQFYGDDAGKSSDYGRIVNRRHFDRVLKFHGEGMVVFGGEHNPDDLFIAPTVLTDLQKNCAVMNEEIFGPILPVVEFDRLDEAVSLLKDRPAPLALYLFTRDRSIEEKILNALPSGGVCINDVVSHMVGTGLPFGGLGASGIGAYHGKAGFDAFSHHRTVVRKATWLDLPFRYPPAKIKFDTLKRAMKFMLRG